MELARREEGSHGKVARPVAGKVLVASGPGWELYWPRVLWEGLTAAEQQDVISRQAALLSHGDETRGRGRPRPAV